ncbi:MAG: mechanosensitive ion channel family protein [Burkholderiales bacterium]|nr:mechanosensitive ion channel family protein [Burkholderiales bacterium]
MESVLAQLAALDPSKWSAPAIVALRVALIALAAWIAAGVVSRMIRLLRIRIASRFADREQVKRAETIGRVLRYTASVVISLIAVVLILSELGVAIAPILGAAGVVGLAIGFGAQSLVKDYFTGLFLLLENQVASGDIVEVAGKAGVVEDLTLRFVKLRDYGGNVHYVPNGQIGIVTNMGRGFAQSVIDVGIAYREDVDEAFAVMREVGSAMRADPAFGAKILDDLEIAGVENWGDSAVQLRCRFRVAPLEQWGVRREFLRRLKRAFDEHGIEIPYPHLTVYAGADKSGHAQPFPVGLAHADVAKAAGAP